MRPKGEYHVRVANYSRFSSLSFKCYSQINSTPMRKQSAKPEQSIHTNLLGQSRSLRSSKKSFSTPSVVIPVRRRTASPSASSKTKRRRTDPRATPIRPYVVDADEIVVATNVAPQELERTPRAETPISEDLGNNSIIFVGEGSRDSQRLPMDESDNTTVHMTASTPSTQALAGVEARSVAPGPLNGTTSPATPLRSAIRSDENNHYMNLIGHLAAGEGSNSASHQSWPPPRGSFIKKLEEFDEALHGRVSEGQLHEVQMPQTRGSAEAMSANIKSFCDTISTQFQQLVASSRRLRASYDLSSAQRSRLEAEVAKAKALVRQKESDLEKEQFNLEKAMQKCTSLHDAEDALLKELATNPAVAMYFIVPSSTSADGPDDDVEDNETRRAAVAERIIRERQATATLVAERKVEHLKCVVADATESLAFARETEGDLKLKLASCKEIMEEERSAFEALRLWYGGQSLE